MQNDNFNYSANPDNNDNVINALLQEDETETQPTAIESVAEENESRVPEIEIREIEQGTKQIDEPKTETRGRHRKDCDCEKCEAKRGNQSSTINNPILHTPTEPTLISPTTNPLDFSEYKDATINPTPENPQQFEAAKFISGSLFLMMLDVACPQMIKWLAGMVNADYKSVNIKDLKLSSDQSKDLEPLADAAVKELFKTLSPTTAFFVAVSLMYGGNFFMAAQAIQDRKPKEKPKEKTNE